MSVSMDGFIADREGLIGSTAPSKLAEVAELGHASVRSQLYETMLRWETDPSFRERRFE